MRFDVTPLAEYSSEMGIKLSHREWAQGNSISPLSRLASATMRLIPFR